MQGTSVGQDMTIDKATKITINSTILSISC